MEFDTVLTADSVEWCPTAGLERVLACGTYQLNESDQTRLGSLMLYNWDEEKLSRIAENETSKFSYGILDMKWNSFKEKGVLAAATSTGAVHYVQLQQLENELNLSDLGEVNLKEEGTHVEGLCLSLSLDWGRLNHCVVVSDSLGRVGLVELSESGPRLKQLWKAHSYEAWIVCFGCDDNVVYSGGDDCKLCKWDTRISTSRPCYTSKWHKMGVCSLQTHPSTNYQHILASGSYDEILALWDVRNMATPLKEKSLGGGIWRIKWNSHLDNVAATACMHNHFNVVNTHLDSAEPIEVVTSYREHKSLAYGVDWCRKHALVENKTEFTLASCSFYDHSMHLWKVSV